ncbi:MAG TPA: helix-hairpin-helix domain-containing protein [Chitinophagaceae bacterium]|jgi:competence ComEA-like helix-hairpin-helix protein|nr:helix-hairpin-helix domain-containing protein [Chitinophagaceae bacterium]
MGWKQQASDYLSFTRKDRIAIIALLLVILGIFFLPRVISRKTGEKPAKADTAWIAAMKRIEQKDQQEDRSYKKYDDNSQAYQYDRPENNYSKRPKGEFFYFDPNTLPPAEWKRLGLRDKTIATIQNYLTKGGKFRKPEDLQRIYGLFPDEYERIAPFIKIESAGESNKYKKFVVKDPATYQPPKTFTGRYTIVDINTTDTTALIALPGIGNKLAARIINFRDKLGGFISINQVGETFGLPDSTFQKIKQYLKLSSTGIRKININTATIDELKAHPYIKYSLANPIIAYRNEHGWFLKVEDIKKVMTVTEELYNKIWPYLTIE